MNMNQPIKFFPIALLLGLFALASGFVLFSAKSSAEISGVSKISVENTEIDGATVLSFGPDQVLFVGDSKNGIVHAISTEATELKDPVPFNLLDLDDQLANMLEMDVRDLIIYDMKIHPVSQEAYIAVKKGHQPESKSVIAIVSPGSHAIRLLDLSKTTHNQVSISNPPSSDLSFWRDIPASTLTITDIDYHDGYMYVAGLSNGEFASNIRKIAYPFNGDQQTVGSIEIYHAVHTQNETRAPIRTMVIEELNDIPTLIASYTCTPLVTIPITDIKEENHIKGKTIAELGYGNAPIDMISYMAQEEDGSFDKKLLVTNKHRGGSLISFKDIEEAQQGKGLAGTKAMGPVGLPIFTAPTSSIMHIDNQNNMMVAAVKRNIDSGKAELVSEIKGAFLRLSEFISEYDFPDYTYPEEQASTQQFHDQVKPMEGFPELASDKKE